MIMKRFYLLVTALLFSLLIKAERVVVDGILYDITTKTKTAKVLPLTYLRFITFDEEYNAYYDFYRGDIIIPPTIEYSGVTYNVTCIGAGAFASVEIPDYGNPRYGTNSALKSVTLPVGVTTIEDQAFYQCSALTKVNLPNGVNKIGSSAFSGCKSLTSISLPEGLTEISGGLFGNCVNLSSVNVPSSVEVIRSSAFSGLASLTNISLHEGLKTIEAYAFHGSGITSIYLPNSVTSIGQESFRNCYNLSSLHLSDSLKSIPTGAFWYDRSLTTVIIPNSVEEIGGLAFRDCDKLKTVIIGSGVKTIWDSFSYCKELTDVYCYADSIPQTYEKAFYKSMIEYATLHVPRGSLDVYKSANVWKEFKNIVALEEESVETKKCESPAIYYEDGHIRFKCNTNDVHFVSRISDQDITTHYTHDIMLTATYDISVYAEKYGYENSDIVYATLCWIDSNPTKGGITDEVANIPVKPILIQNNGGILTIQGANDDTLVSVYDINGKITGTSTSKNGTVMVNTNLDPGSIAIVKIGERSVKVLIK